jgi:hypothetical protein
VSPIPRRYRGDNEAREGVPTILYSDVLTSIAGNRADIFRDMPASRRIHDFTDGGFESLYLSNLLDGHRLLPRRSVSAGRLTLNRTNFVH